MLIMGLLLLLLLMGTATAAPTLIGLTVGSHQTISSLTGSGGFTASVPDGSYFGGSSSGIGDVNGDTIPDIAIGATGGYSQSPSVYIMMMNTDGSVLSHQQISESTGDFTASLFLSGSSTFSYSYFGSSVSGIGDLNSDGIPDIVVGDYYYGTVEDIDDAPAPPGAAFIVFLRADGTCLSHHRISPLTDGFTASIPDGSYFGGSSSGIGDVNGDTIPDIAIGASGLDSVYIVMMNTDGSVLSHQQISELTGDFTASWFPDSYFGRSVSGIGDLNSDGISDIVVGDSIYGSAGGDDAGTGAAFILFLRADGTCLSHRIISSLTDGFTASLPDGSYFGGSSSGIGDVNGDTIPDIAIGATGSIECTAKRVHCDDEYRRVCFVP